MKKKNSSKFFILPKIHERDILGVMDEWIDSHRWTAYMLAGIAVGTVLTVAVAAPGALQVAGFSRPDRRTYNQMTKARLRLLHGWLIASVRKPDGTRGYRLTKKGEKKLAEFLIAARAKQNHGRWDGRWRVLLYDIPESHRKHRDRIREVIRMFGCYQLQKNVWIYPYPSAKDLLVYLHLLYGKGGADILLVETKSFDGDQKARIHFGFKKT
jgi:hypothetical protein